MKHLSFVLALSFCLASALPAYADSLSANAVFGEETAATAPEAQSAEQRLQRTRDLIAGRAKGSTAGAADAPAWKSEGESSLGGAGLKMFQALGICVGILLIGLHFFKKYNPKAVQRVGGRRMRVIERLPIAQKTALLLVEVDGRTVLLSVGSDRVSQVSHEAQDELGLGLHNSMDFVCQDDVKAHAA